MAAGPDTYLVLIPSYEPGARLAGTVADALCRWPHVWLVIDGGDDDSGVESQDGLRVIRRARNGGKGAAVLEGVRAAVLEGFTHALVMDADGQHPAAEIGRFIEISMRNPSSMILGVPIFDASAPRVRVLGRRISNVLARLEARRGIGDALFGFRVYPLRRLLMVMEASRHMRRYDFDTEAVVRLCWEGVPVVNVPAAVRYFSVAEGGVSHFRYGRDNLLLAAMHLRLICGALCR